MLFLQRILKGKMGVFGSRASRVHDSSQLGIGATELLRRQHQETVEMLQSVNHRMAAMEKRMSAVEEKVGGLDQRMACVEGMVYGRPNRPQTTSEESALTVASFHSDLRPWTPKE